MHFLQALNPLFYKGYRRKCIKITFSTCVVAHPEYNEITVEEISPSEETDAVLLHIQSRLLQEMKISQRGASLHYSAKPSEGLQKKQRVSICVNGIPFGIDYYSDGG